ncbi:MAG: translocation/assembly module TamB domain-containing protein [Flavobacteriales bacterium]|jgi:hypothetical protein
MAPRKKKIRIVQYLFVGLVTLVMGGYFALQTPAVQSWIGRRVADYLSSEWNTEVSVGRVSIDLWARLHIDDIYIEDQRKDTLLFIEHLHASKYTFDRQTGKLVIAGVELNRPYFNLVRHKQDSLLNYYFLVDYFDSGDTTSAQESDIRISELSLKNGRFNYINEHRDSDTTFGIDWNHLQLSAIDLSVSQFSMLDDSIHATVNTLSAQEASGFKLHELSHELTLANNIVDMRNTRLAFEESDIRGDLRFEVNSIDDFDYFDTRVPMQHEFHEAKLNMNDLSYFAPELRGMNQPVVINGTVKGTVANLKGRKLSLTLNDHTRFEGNVDMEGLPELSQTYISLDIKELTTNKEELEQIPLPPFDGHTFVEVPGNFAALGQITYRGDFTGFISDFVSYGMLQTAIGDIRTDISLKEDTARNDYRYSGSIELKQFNLGQFYDVSALGPVSCNFNLDGSGLELKKVDAGFNGTISEISANGYTYHNIQTIGNFKHRAFNGEVHIDDPNLMMDFAGTIDFTKAQPLLAFDADIRHANLDELNVLKDYDYSAVSGEFHVSSEGLEFEKFVGEIVMSDFTYCAMNRDYALNNLKITASRTGTPVMTLVSDLAFAEISGEYKLSQIPSALAEIASRIFPSFQPPIREHKDQQFTVLAQIYDVSQITEVFVPELVIAPGTRVNLEVNEPAGFFQTILSSPHIEYADTRLESITFDVHHPDESFYVTASCDMLNSGGIIFRDIAVDGRTQQDTLFTAITWNNGNRQFEGDINGRLAIQDFDAYDFFFDASTFTLEKERWAFTPGAHVSMDSSDVNVNGLTIFNGNQRLTIGGTINASPSSALNIQIAAFDLSNLNVFVGEDYRFEGIVSGNAQIADPYHEIIFRSDIDLAQLVINDRAIGDLHAQTAWDPRLHELRIDGSLEKDAKASLGLNRYTPLSFAGYYRPRDEKSPLDLTATINLLDLEFINAFMEPEILDIQGFASGTMAITGTPDAPQMRANALLRDASIYVYYLNTKYYIEEQIGVYPDMFTFDHIRIHDEKGKQGYLTGQMLHDNFGDWNFDIMIDMEEPMLAMNTTEELNSMYYGQAYTTGNVNIYGYEDQLEFDIALKSEKGTTLAMPMGVNDEQTFENFIRFKSPNDSIQAEEPLNLSGIKLNLQMEITPDAEFKIIFDESVGDVMSGAGRGNLQMEINNLATFNMYGGVELTRGDYLFTLKNLINKPFRIKPGGTISWFGDPFGGEMDLQAIYDVSASLYDLIQDPAYQNGQRVPVDLGMNLTGKIFNPGIDFSIDLPTVDQVTKSRVNAVISTDQERNRQAFALLVMRRFVSPPNVTADHSSTSAFAANGTEFLSSQISSWLSQISDDFNLGFNYSPGDDISNEEIALALGTQLFNERLSLSSNFGVSRNNGTSQANQNATNIIGDIRIEYKITPEGRIRLVMYNESNDFRATTVQQSPYTQGVGIIYREDFDTFDEFIEGFKKLLKGNGKSSSAMTNP